MREKLSKAEIMHFLKNDSAGVSLSVVDITESTNSDLKKAAQNGAPDGIVFIAESQTAGRGRMGRDFYSPPGSGIYLSYLYKGEFEPDTTVRMTTAASVAACRAIERVTGLSPQIKWVNDIYLYNKKICGILAEAVTEPQSGRIIGIVVGIGINCTTDCFPEELSEKAGSIIQGGQMPRSELAAAVITEFKNVKNLAESGSYIDEYKRRSMVIGKEIEVSYDKKTVFAIDIDKNGGLVVKYNDGRIKTLSSGEISIRIK